MGNCGCHPCVAVTAEDGLALFGMGVKCHCSSKDAEVQEEILEIPASTPHRVS